MHQYSERRYIIQFIFLIVGCLFIVRLIYIQLIDDTYLLSANNNVLRKVTLYPPRGLIYDRNGKILVYNEAVYDLMVLPRQVKDSNIPEICSILSITQDEFDNRLKKVKKFSVFRASIFEKQIPQKTFAVLQEQFFELPGFYGQSRTKRRYPYANASHLLGYIGEVNNNHIKKSGGYYAQGDYIGISGIEKTYEEILRGEKGIQHVIVDVHNKEQGLFKEGKYDTAGITGNNITITVDIDLQQYGELLMKNKIGSIVALEPSTGEILSFVSSPSYDPNLLSGSERGMNYDTLSSDSSKPLFVRPIMAEYPPGSIAKTILALVCLQEGIVTPGFSYPCEGGYHIGNLKVGCHEHPVVYNIQESVQYSCNAYYCELFRKIISSSRYRSTENAYQNWRNYLLSFGIGKELNIDLPNEKTGSLPTSNRYNRLYGKNGWKYSNIISLGIGQGELGCTPLQMANMAAIIANKGYYFPPHFIKRITNNNSTNQQYKTKSFTKIDSCYYEIIIDAMYDVVERGTGTLAKIDSIQVCGKTGTAQNPHGEDHSIFIAFAPKINPQIAVSVVVENAGYGGVWAAPIASLMIEKYLTDSISHKRLWHERRIVEKNFID